MSNSTFTKLPASQIISKRIERQRRVLTDIEELADSIRQHNLFTPVIINRDNVLIAGERRLEACKLIDPEYLVTVQYIDTLPEDEQLIEYEENAARKDLVWQDSALAIYNIHKILKARDPNWTPEKTGKKLSYTQQHISKYLSVADALLKKDEQIEEAESLSKAVSILSRRNKRDQDNIINAICQVEERITAETTTVCEVEGKTLPLSSSSSASIQNADFIEWATSYKGQKFNCLHCDFPYGVGHDNSAQGGTSTGRWEGYEDSEEVYWSLLEALASNLDQILLPSAHIMFWFSMKFYPETLEFFRTKTDLRVISPHPLVWMKSDGKGITPDVNRGPRQICETALFLSRGDRSIIKPVANGCFLPSKKADAIHVSEKPVGVLKHFFEMFVDENTELLDPTCGSGSSIRAAASMGAKRAVGLEVNENFASHAQETLDGAIGLRALLPADILRISGETNSKTGEPE